MAGQSTWITVTLPRYYIDGSACAIINQAHGYLDEHKSTSEDKSERLCALLDKNSSANAAYSTERQLIQVHGRLRWRWESLIRNALGHRGRYDNAST